MKRNLILLSLFLIILISLFAGEYYFYNKKLDKQKVIIANRNLEKGIKVTKDDLKVIESINFNNDKYIHTINEVENSFLKKDINKGQVFIRDCITNEEVLKVNELLDENNVFISLEFKHDDANCWRFEINDMVDLFFSPNNSEYNSKSFQNLRVVKILDRNLKTVNRNKEKSKYLTFEVSRSDAKEILNLKNEGYLSILSY